MNFVFKDLWIPPSSTIAGAVSSAADATAVSVAAAMLASTAVPVLADGYTIANTPKCIGISWWDRMEAGNERYAEASGNDCT